MSKILKSLQLVTQSYAGTPSTGTGALYTSGSTVYFENANGTIFPLGYTGNNAGYVIVREYTGSNPGGENITYNWSNPPNAKLVQVLCVGGGGGGGSGAYRTTIGVALIGGGGGGGAAMAWGFFDKKDLPLDNYTIVVGAGGAGGAPRTVSNTAGLAGSAGQYTTFGGTIISASGGRGGSGGPGGSVEAPGGYGGFAFDCLPGPAFAIGGITGAQTSDSTARHTVVPPMFGQTEPPAYTSATPPPTIGGFTMTVSNPPMNLSLPANAAGIFPTPPYGCAGGGGGATTSSVGLNNANTGSSGYLWGSLVLNNPILSGSGTNNLIPGHSLFQFTGSIPFTTQYGLGGGGNGGPIFGRPGGNGGNYGAGGGGSSFAIAAPGSAAGGSGSAGLCIVIEYY